MGFTHAKNTETALGNPVLEHVFAKICIPYIARKNLKIALKRRQIMNETKTNNIVVTINGYGRSNTTEKAEKERLKYWSSFYMKRNHIKGTCSAF